VEAWFLADRETAAASLHIHERAIPRSPDSENDPKLTIVNLARGSTKPAIREALVPPRGFSRKAGPGYEAWLIRVSNRWSFKRAVKQSESLARAHRCLTTLREAWEQSQQ